MHNSSLFFCVESVCGACIALKLLLRTKQRAVSSESIVLWLHLLMNSRERIACFFSYFSFSLFETKQQNPLCSRFASQQKIIADDF